MKTPAIVRKKVLELRLASARRAVQIARQEWDSACKCLRAMELDAQRLRREGAEE